MSGFAVHILAGDQKLSDGMMVFAEQLVICIHQLALANGGSGLFPGNVPGTLPQAQLPHAHSDGAGRDQNDLIARVFDIADDLAQLSDPADIQMSGGVGQGGGPDFYNDAHFFHIS